jgi:hypothetical protein
MLGLNQGHTIYITSTFVIEVNEVEYKLYVFTRAYTRIHFTAS